MIKAARSLFLFTLCFISFSLNSKCQNIQSTDSIATNKNTDEVNDKIFIKVEVEPAFPGWNNYLRDNLNTQVGADNGAPEGTYTVVVRFIVSKNGHISEVSAETRQGYGMEEEVIRIIKKSRKWIPATQNGRVVNAYRRQPVTFTVTK